MMLTPSSAPPIPTLNADEVSEQFAWHPGQLTFEPLHGICAIQSSVEAFEICEFVYCENHTLSDTKIYAGKDSGLVSVYIPVSGCFEVETQGTVIQSSEKVGTIESGKSIKSYTVHSGRYQRVLVIDYGWLIKSLSAHTGQPIIEALQFHPVFDIDELPGAFLNALALTLHQGCVMSDVISRSPLLATNLSEAVVEVLLAFMPHNFSYLYEKRPVSGESWQTRRAMDYMVANASRPLSVAEVAMACNVSVRTLYFMFRQQLDTTPKRYLRNVRLAGARGDIVDSSNNQPIAMIARRWGFMSLSLFAKQYHQAFGELPLKSRNERRKGNSDFAVEARFRDPP